MGREFTNRLQRLQAHLHRHPVRASRPLGLKHSVNDSFVRPPHESCDLCSVFVSETELWGRKNFRLVLKPESAESTFQALGIAYGGSEAEISYPLFTNEGDPAVGAGVRVLHRPELPSSLECYDTAKSWIQECVSSHDCGTSHTTSSPAFHSLPARLIDLDAFGPTSTNARLVDVADVGSSVVYATLSYCWGSGMSSQSITTVNTLPRRQERIDPFQLPRTLRDAFAVTRQLAIRYLWVDALCIVQDSPSDWATESAKMADIYSRGLVSLAASLAFSVSDGFLSHKPEDDNPCVDHLIKISNTLKGGEQSVLYVWIGRTCRCFVKETINALQDTALSERGWAFQERFLAPRVLHFAGAQVLWESHVRHGVPLEVGTSLADAPKLHKIPAHYAPVARLLSPSTLASPTELRNRWYDDVVVEFSRRALTFPDDKLPAISGIARIFAAKMEDAAYVAGSWMDDIVFALSWVPIKRAVLPAAYRAPSWSWASTDGEVDFHYDPSINATPLVTLESFQVQRTGSDVFGRIHAASITLRGSLGAGTIQNELFWCDSSGQNLGHAFMDEERVEGRTEGWKMLYVPVYSLAFKTLMLLLRKRNGDDGYVRIGISIGVVSDFEFADDKWLETHCKSMELTLF